METFLLIVFFGLALLFSALWMKEKYGEDTRTTVQNVYKQLSSIEEKVSSLTPAIATVPDANDGPVTQESVREALRYHHFIVEEPDPDESGMVQFSCQKIYYRINMDKLPLLSIEAVYRLDPREEDIDFMMQVAQDITNGMYIVKVMVLPEKEAYVYQVDLIADTYQSFRDNLGRYMDLLVDAQRRFLEQYRKKRDEQKKVSEEALQTTLLAAQTDASGNVLPS